MGQAAVSETNSEQSLTSESTSLVVLVAADIEDRAALLAQLDPAAPVLIVPSIEMAQQVMTPRRPQGHEACSQSVFLRLLTG